MRRLTARHPLTRLRDERGAIAVAVALFMPILFGAAAIAIDTSAVWSARQQVETGADAAVIAVAMDCARGNCGDIKATSEAAMWANDKAAKVADLGPGIGLISVNNRKIDQTITTPWLVKHYFAAALGHDTGSLTVESHAAWAPAARATSAIPLAVSYCDYKALSGSLGSHTAATLSITSTVGGTCTGPNGGAAGAKGIGVTETDDGSGCQVTSTWNGEIQRAKPVLAGKLPAGCTNAYLSSLVGKDVAIPVFDTVSDKAYHVCGYSAFHVTGYSGSATPSFSGYFTYAARQVDDTTPPATTAPDLGFRSVFLTKS